MNETFLLRSDYDGIDISVLMVRPDFQPVAVLQIAHGMRGHKERFMPLMTYLSQRGIACVANDHRGHGDSVRSPDDRGYMYSGGYVALVEDMRMVTDWIHTAFPKLPVFILGHSMGSLAVRTYMKTHDDLVDGAFICGSPSDSPAAHMALPLFHFLTLFRHGRMRQEIIPGVTSRIFSRRFNDGGNDSWLCSDPDVRNDFSSDPSCSYDFTANAMYAMMNMMRETYSYDGWKVSNPDMPIYFISGEQDSCMRGEKSFHKSAHHMVKLGYHDVTSAIYPGMRHEVLNEIGKERVWDDILDHIRSWM